MSIRFQKDYITYLIEDLENTSTWEVEVFLNDSPDSDIWFLLIDKGIPWKEENIFYHKKVGNSVFFYWVNRTNPVLHTASSQVLLTNAIDALNYFSDFINQAFHIYKKSEQNVIITGWKIYEDWSVIDIIDYDSEWLLAANYTNYIYLIDGVIIATTTEDLTKYLLAEIDVELNWDITNIRQYRLWVGRWITWWEGIQWPQWLPWADGTDWTNWTDWTNGTNGTDWTNWIDGTNWTNGTNWIDWINGTDGTDWTNWIDGTNWVDWVDWEIWINRRWPYNVGTSYLVNDWVTYEWSSYICTTDSIGNIPTANTYWDLLASKGLLYNNIILYPTTASWDFWYNIMVSDLLDTNFDDPAIDIPTWEILWNNQLLAWLISEPWLFIWNIGTLNIPTIWNIAKIAGNSQQYAEFYFEVYKRNIDTTETLVATSATTWAVNPQDDSYYQFSASALLNDWDWAASDRIVIKYYANMLGNPWSYYNFQFGWASPIRTSFDLPINTIVKNASQISYDNTASWMTADNVQDALDDISVDGWEYY
jgi:hypothetical protein